MAGTAKFTFDKGMLQDATFRALFDADWYAANYPDVRLSGMQPEEHYLRVGAYLKRPPRPTLESTASPRPDSARFSIDAYRLANEEVPKDPSAAWIHRFANAHRTDLITNWLDRYTREEFGAAESFRISSLLDLLLSSSESDKSTQDLLARFRRAVDLQTAVVKNGPQPQASIIIPVFNQARFTLASITSVIESSPKRSYEIVIADDCSTDETMSWFSDYAPLIRIVRTEGNLGFLRNCNNAAATCQGAFLILLNNDTVVMPQWLDELVDTLQREPSCGLVGSKFLGLDGSLQEAGGIVWKDGSAWNYGRGKDPRAPEFNYVRKVDYCSGASICLRRSVWEEVSGFDPEYAPAYCEDSDLSFRLTSKGLSTLYQPTSVLIHLEGVSCGTDTSSGIKCYQLINKDKLVQRWKDTLLQEHFPNAEHVFHARGKTRDRKCIVVVDHYIPRPDQDAGSRTMLHIIDVLLEKGYVVVLWPDNLHYDVRYARFFQQMGVLVAYGAEFVSSFESWLSDHAAYVDGFLLSRPHIATKYVDTIRQHSSAPIAYYGHDIHHLRLRQQLASAPGSVELALALSEYEHMEMRMWESADVVYYPSQPEVDYVLSCRRPNSACNKVRVLAPWAFKDFCTDAHVNLSARKGLLFVGGFKHPPNIEGVIWFVREVWPLLKKGLEDVTLTIAGSHPNREIKDLATKDIKVLGYVSDEELERLYHSARVAVVPLLHGAGVKGKVIEALRFGLPVVTTSVGAEGIPDAKDALAVKDSPRAMAEKINNLLVDSRAWTQASAASLQLVQRHYSPDVMWAGLQEAFYAPAK
jgi:GT2 family glycosyltransferase